MLFDWSRKLAPPSQPIRCKLKPIAPWSLAFSRATGRLHAFTSSCHWLPLIISFTLIGRCDYFGFGFRHSIENRSIGATLTAQVLINPTKFLCQQGLSLYHALGQCRRKKRRSSQIVHDRKRSTTPSLPTPQRFSSMDFPLYLQP